MSKESLVYAPTMEQQIIYQRIMKPVFLVNSESDWVEKLKHLILNPDLIKEMGLKSRIYTEKNFSKENISMKYIQALKEL